MRQAYQLMMNNNLLDLWMKNGGDEESFAQELILSYATFASLSTEHKKVMVCIQDFGDHTITTVSVRQDKNTTQH